LKNILMAVVLVAASFPFLVPAASAVALGEKALCRVCHVREGSTEEETVKAVRTHEGTTYGFCNENCAKEFDTDPIGYLPAVFPRPVPAMALRDLAGQAVDWKRFDDQVVLVDFWATWCVPCRKVMPELQALHQKYASRGFSVLGISVDTQGPANVKKFVSSRKLTYPIAIDDTKDPVWQRYRVKAVPAAFLVDREGRIVAQWTGAADVEDVEAKLATLLAPASVPD
jgi:thiol-disulfide isomerase/thioredoxin